MQKQKSEYLVCNVCNLNKVELEPRHLKSRQDLSKPLVPKSQFLLSMDQLLTHVQHHLPKAIIIPITSNTSRITSQHPYHDFAGMSKTYLE